MTTRAKQLLFALITTAILLPVGHAFAVEVDTEYVKVVNGRIAERCEINSLIDGLFHDFDQTVQDTFNRAFDQAKALITDPRFLICLFKPKISIPIIGGVDYNTTCTIDIGGEQVSYLKAAREEAIKRTLDAQCYSSAVFEFSTRKMIDVLNENGRDGGPVWIQDYGDLITNAEMRGDAQLRALLAGSNICPEIRDMVYRRFNVVPSRDAASLSGLQRVDGQMPPTEQLACTIPDGMTPDEYIGQAIEKGNYWEAYQDLLEPQNNFGGIVSLIEELQQKLVSTEVEADKTEAIAGNGAQGIRDCLTMNAAGVCLRYGPIKQPGATLSGLPLALIQADLQNLLLMAQSSSTGAQENPMLRILSRLLDLTKPDPATELRLNTNKQ